MEAKSEISSTTAITVGEFRKQYFRKKKPVLLRGMASSWPALQKWDFDFLSKRPGPKVALELGNVIQGKTDFVTADYNAYMDQLRSPADAASAQKPTSGKEKPYLSLFDIFSAFPELERDVDFSLFESLCVTNYVFAWIGPAGTITGFHVDWIDNVLAQVHGRKRVTLVAPNETKYMYPSPKYEYRSMLSRVDPLLKESFPRYAKAHPKVVHLEPGDMLYIPRGWWHRVESLTPSISVNKFGHDVRGVLFSQTRTSIKHALHKLGVVGRRGCTCHMSVNGAVVAHPVTGR